MCLAVPGNIVSIGEHARAVVDMLGAQREVSLRLVPEARVGDYVLVHAGFGIQVISAEDAQETSRLVPELPGLVEEDLALGGTDPNHLSAPADVTA